MMYSSRVLLLILISIYSSALCAQGSTDAAAKSMVPVVGLLLDDGDSTVRPPLPPPPPPPGGGSLDTNIILTTAPGVNPTASELVTFGLPIADGVVTNLNQISVRLNGVEQRACIEQTMTWWNSNSVRAIKVQLRNVNMTDGDLTVTVGDFGRDPSLDLSCLPVTDGWVSAGATKSNELSPRIFGLHDPAYLAASNIIAPHASAPATEDDFERYVVAQVENWSGDLNYDSSTAANWLFDRSTAYFKNYITTGRLELLKEAGLSKQYYFQLVRNDDVDPRPQGGSGCWTKPGVACADGKYIAPQQAKLALALLGDDSQWDNELIIKMATQADLGWNQYHCSRAAPNDQNFGFTERACGLVGLSQLAAYEMTGDAGRLATMNEIIAYLKSIQQTVFAWDTSNNWTPKSGAFTHDTEVHEGDQSVSSAPDNFTDAQGFSSWMSENTADFLWQVYWVTGNSDAPEMLRRLGNAIDLYGYASAYNPSSKAHDRLPPFVGNPRVRGCNSEKIATELLYFGSAFASNARRSSDDWWAFFTDAHNIEVVLPLAAAYYFETNVVNKERLKARIDKIIDGNLSSNCATSANPRRMFNWQHRSNSVRTWYWVKQQ